MATVTHIEEGFTNTGRLPYALARLGCGHAVHVILRDTRGTCCGCGAPMTHPYNGGFVRCSCGAYMTDRIDSPNPHRAEDRLTKVGDAVECGTCAAEAKQLAWLRELPRGSVHHARPRHGSYHLYRHDVASPSGFFLMGTVPMTAAADEALRAASISPISPVEAA